MADRDAETVARRFHEEYERMAPAYGWATQEASRVEWGDLPPHQRALMVHVVGNLMAEGVITAFASPPEDRLIVPERDT